MEEIIEGLSGNPIGQSVFLTVGGLAGVFVVLFAFFFLIKLLMKVMPKGKE
jgi:hypothetical protein